MRGEAKASLGDGLGLGKGDFAPKCGGKPGGAPRGGVEPNIEFGVPTRGICICHGAGDRLRMIVWRTGIGEGKLGVDLCLHNTSRVALSSAAPVREVFSAISAATFSLCSSSNRLGSKPSSLVGGHYPANKRGGCHTLKNGDTFFEELFWNHSCLKLAEASVPRVSW